MFDLQQTVANLVLDHSECAEIFQRYRIDFCCHGDVAVQDAARARGVALDELQTALTRAIETRRGERPLDPRQLSTPELVAHIIAEHHEYLRRALPFVRMLADKVGRVHGEHNPKLVDLASAVEALATALLPHLDAEEEQLFPLLLSPQPDLAAVDVQLTAMEVDHRQVATLLEQVRAASDDFSVPAWGCNSYRALFGELEQLESDVFKHVHLENHVLEPRFAQA